MDGSIELSMKERKGYLRTFCPARADRRSALASPTLVAAVTETRSHGPVVGHLKRLTTIKRRMYGRAGFRLLRAQLVYANEVIRHRLEPPRRKRADVFTLRLLHLPYNDAEFAAMREVPHRIDPRSLLGRATPFQRETREPVSNRTRQYQVPGHS
jgi:hypothetical protein